MYVCTQIMERSREVITKYHNGERDNKNSFQHIANCMRKWCNPFQCVRSKLQMLSTEQGSAGSQQEFYNVN